VIRPELSKSLTGDAKLTRTMNRDTREAIDSAALLVVDDSEGNRDALCRRLQRRGYAVTGASDGLQALALVAQGGFDLVLLDVMMPGLNGLEVLEQIRQTHPATELPVIMASAKDQSEDIVRALELGANDYVTKPIDFEVALARVRTHLALKRAVHQVVVLEQRLSHRNWELEVSNAQMRRDLEAAAKIQKAFLPKTLPVLPGLRFAWSYHPCEALAGDFLNICPLGDEQFGMYVLDVSGHGVAAALLAVTLSRVLSPAGDPDSVLLRSGGQLGARLVPPTEVAERLNQRFPWDEETEQFFTIVYGVLDAKTGQFRYVSAGHPGVAHLSRDAETKLHPVAGFPIGLGEAYDEFTIQMQPGDRLYLYSDGVTEAMNPDGQLFGDGQLLHALDNGRADTLERSLSLLVDDLATWCGGTPSRDDISILAVEMS